MLYTYIYNILREDLGARRGVVGSKAPAPYNWTILDEYAPLELGNSRPRIVRFDEEKVMQKSYFGLLSSFFRHFSPTFSYFQSDFLLILRSYLHEQDALRQQLGVKALQRKMKLDLDQQVRACVEC